MILTVVSDPMPMLNFRWLKRKTCGSVESHIFEKTTTMVTCENILLENGGEIISYQSNEFLFNKDTYAEHYSLLISIVFVCPELLSFMTRRAFSLSDLLLDLTI